jgi:hypothetical protein
MPRFVKDDVLVGLIRDQPEIASLHDCGDALEIGTREHSSGRVVGELR